MTRSLMRTAVDDLAEIGEFTMHEVADSLGVPFTQLARWVADGSVDEDLYTGNPLRPERVTFKRRDVLRRHTHRED